MRKKRIYICLIMVLFFMVIGYSALNTNIFATGDIILTNNLDDFKVYIKNIFIDGNDYSNNIENGESFTVSNINELKKIKYSIMNESYEYDTKVEMKCSSITTNEEITFDIGTIEAQMSKEDEIQLDAGKCSYENGYTWDFDSNGTDGIDESGQEYVVPCEGTYKVELWGASGQLNGQLLAPNSDSVGLGSYTSGNIYEKKSSHIYIFTGTNTQSQQTAYTFNGGGIGEQNGGGATDIRTVNSKWFNFESLKSRIMVAGGGGGGSFGSYKTGDENTKGSAGGLIGYDAHINVENYGFEYSGHGASQTQGGKSGKASNVTSEEQIIQSAFGKGGLASNKYSSGGGSGYYGGGLGVHPGSAHTGGGGGSSFISGHNGCDAISASSTESNIIHTGQSIHYSGYYFTNTKMIDGNGYAWTNTKQGLESMPNPNGGYYPQGQGHSGNGYARITLLNSEPITSSYTCTIEVTGIERNTKSKEYCSKLIGKTWEFDYNETDGTDGASQIFTTPCQGTYQLETWGASGGYYQSNYYSTRPGYGGYSVGKIDYNQNEKLHIYVGGSGKNCTYGSGYCTLSGGYNGGGAGYSDNQFASGGGGATHIATQSGLLSSLQNNTTSIQLVAGGGGGSGYAILDNESNMNRPIKEQDTSPGVYLGNGGSGGGKTGGAPFDGWAEKGNGDTTTSYNGGPGNQEGVTGTYMAYSLNPIVTAGFGQGGTISRLIECCANNGGGGGFYGGSASARGHGGGGGGSGYIGNESLNNKAMYCFDCEESKEVSTKTISTTGEEADKTNCPNGYSSSPISKCAKQGHGYARITLLNLN